MLKTKEKAEIQALSSFGFQYLSQVRLHNGASLTWGAGAFMDRVVYLGMQSWVLFMQGWWHHGPFRLEFTAATKGLKP